MRPIAATINHLLMQDARAQAQLAVHRGKVACIDTGIFQLRLQVDTAGFLEAAPSEAVPNVTIRVKLSDIPLILVNRERAVSYVNIAGDADFANTISQLSQSLRWDAEDDLSKVVGDIAATRIVAGAQSMVLTVQSTTKKLAENTAEYFLEEQPMLVRPQATSGFATEVAKLRDDVERLSKRLEKLEK